MSQAIGEIEFALAQLKQKKAEALGQIFPAAPSGWTAEKAQGSSAGGAMFGGGVSATRSYRDGEQGPGQSGGYQRLAPDPEPWA